MNVKEELSQIAVLLGQPARILMLWNLLGGELRPASELAFFANVSPQSASMHLSKLVEAQLLEVTKEGRHRYYTIAKPEVADFVESMAALLPSNEKPLKTPISKRPDFHIARSCYDHLAGKISVEIVESMLAKDILISGKKDFEVTDIGYNWFVEFGIDIEKLKKKRRSFAKKCLDWSEREHHLAGALGSALLGELFERKWLVRSQGRALRITLTGRENMNKSFGIII